MRFKFALIPFALYFINGVSVFSQEPHIRFRHLSYRDGLIQSPIVTMLQDETGYVWVGSWSGLSRYDGTAFKNFRQNDTTGSAISHNRINRIFEGKDGKLWMATSGGLNLYNKKTEKFRHIDLQPGKGGGNYIATVQEDSYGKLWVSTFKGLKFVNDAQDKLETVSSWKEKENDLFEGISFSLFEDREKIMWVGVKKGLKRFDPLTRNVLPLPELILSNQDIATSKIVVMRQDNAGDIWLGTEENGLFRYNKEKNFCIRYTFKEGDRNCIPSNWINDILLKDNKVWIATRSGLSIFDPQTNTFKNYSHDSADPRSLNDDSVWSLMEDQTGNVWMGTYSGGINIYYAGNSNFVTIGEKIGNHAGLNKPLANAIVEDEAGALWFGTFGGGLNYIDRNRDVVKYYSVKDVAQGKLSDEIKAIAKGKDNKLWLGTLDGLCVFDRNTTRIKYIDLEIRNEKTTTKLINALVADQDGIWVGTNGNGVRFVTHNGEEQKSIVSNPGLSNGLNDNYVNALLKSGNDLWIATQNGLTQYNVNQNTFTLFSRNKNFGLSNGNVLTLYKDSNGWLWAGTDGGGLNCLDTSAGKIYVINRTNGLADDVINCVLEDDQGKIWASTNNGLSQISFSRKAFPLRAEDFKIINYTAANGLPSNQYLVNAGLKTQAGELLFGGVNGVVTFFPEKIVRNNHIPQILLTGLAIRNKEVSFGDHSILKYPINESTDITLPYDDNNITLKFSALNFINPGKNVYAYKMDGLESGDEWIEIGNQKEVSFVNLKPGEYTFHVKAANNDDVWNNEGRHLSITILPPLWQTWWAYLLYGVVVFLSAYKIIQFFRIRAKLERDLYNEHLQNERQQEFYKMKMDFFTNISHEIRTPLTLILGPVESLDKKTQDDAVLNRQVLHIRNNAERLLRLVGELMDFRKAETGNMVLDKQRHNLVPFIKEIFLSFQSLAESRHIQYDFVTADETIILHADNNQLEKVFFNLLSNAFKFTPNHGEIKLEIARPGDGNVAVYVMDNGKGIPAAYQDKLFTNFYQVQPDKSQPGTGVGLALSKSIIELHGGTIDVQSIPATTKHAGKTIFTVKLPLAESTAGVLETGREENVAAYLAEAQESLSGNGTSSIDGQKCTILLAEDNNELRNFIIESLSAYHVIAFVNGADAYENAVEEIPDLIISDVMMPVMNGLEFCKKIKTDERTSHIPVILLTALAAHIHQVNGLETGADLYMTKPFSTHLLELNVRNILSSRELMRKKFSQQVVLQPLNVPISSPDEVFIKKLMQIVEDNMENPDFGVTELGDEIGMSKTVLYKKVCALTDLSPADFIKSMRLKKARLLLENNAFNVNEVAALVGFNDRKYFSKEFKKFHGKTPSEILSPSGDADQSA